MHITFKLNEFTELPQDRIDSLPRWGSCDTAISQIMMFDTVKCDRSDAINYLTHIGYDDPEQLQIESNETLTGRVLWLACLDCRDNGSTQFYMGE